MEIKPYDPARKAEVLELIRVCLGDKPDIRRDPRWWDWRHEELLGVSNTEDLLAGPQ